MTAAAILALQLTPIAQAATYYWDNNSTTAGFGTAGGSWLAPTVSQWGTDSTGVAATGASITTTTADSLNFGSGATGLAAGTITTGTVAAGDMTFAAGSGAIVLSGGTITLAAAETTTVNNTTDTISSIIAGAATSFTKAGTGTLIFTGANTYVGATIINAGTLTIGNGTTGSLNGTTGTALTFNGRGGIFNVAEAAGSTQGMGALTFSAGSGTVTSTAAGATSAATLIFASMVARTAGATGNFSLATNTTSTGATPNKIVFTNTTNVPLSTGSNNQGLFFGGSEYARYDAAGYVRAVIYGTDTNAPAIVATAATIGTTTAATDIKISGAITAQTTATLNTLNLAAITPFTFSNAANVLSVNGITATGTNVIANTTTVSLLQPAVAGGELVVNVTGTSLSIAQIIQNNTSASRLTKSGTGTLILSGVNTYTGATNVNAGTLSITAGSIAAASPINIAAGATLTTSVNNSFGNPPTGAWTIAGTITGTNNAQTLPASITLNNGTMSGASFTTLGTFLANVASTTITANGAANTISAGNIGITATTTLTFATPLATDALSVSSVLGGSSAVAGAVTKSGQGTVTLSGANIYTGATTVSGGTLNLTGNRTAATGLFTVGSGSAGTLGISNGTFTNAGFTIGNTGANGIVNQTGGSLTASGGNLFLIGNGTGTGTYNLSAGTLTVTALANRGIMLAVNDGTSATFNLSGTGTLAASASILMIGRSDTGVSNTTSLFNQTGGTATVGTLNFGAAAAATGTTTNNTLTITAGTFAATTFTNLAASNGNTSVINIGGTAVVTLPAFPTVRGTSSTATINFDGGTLKNAAASATYLGGLTNAFIKAGGAAFDTTAGDITITQSLLTFGAGSPNGGLTKLGVNTLTLTGTNTYTGNSTASVGILSFANSLAIPGYSTSPATAFGTFAAPKMSAASGATIALPFGAATNAVTATDIANLLNGTYNVFAVGSSLGIDTTNASPSPANLTTVITNTTLGQLGFTKTGVNVLNVNPANTYTGATLIANGTLNVSVLGNVGGASSSLGAQTTAALATVSLGSFTNTGTLSYTGTGETSNRAINLSGTTGGGVIDNSGSGTLTFSSPMTFTGTGAKALTLSGASDIAFGSTLGTNGVGTPAALTINKNGANTVTLNGALTTITSLNISGGVLDIGTAGLSISNTGNNVIQASGNATINATGGGFLTLSSNTATDGGNLGATSGNTLTINANITTSGTGGTIELFAGAGTTGVVVFNGANTYTGTTIINSGMLSVANFGNPGSTTSNLGSGSTINIGNGANAGIALRYTGAGETSSRTINLSGTSGTVTIDQSGPSGALVLSSPFTATGAGAKTLTLQGSTAGTGEISGAIVNSTLATSVTKAGTGTWTLSGVNTYTGATTVNGGKLILSNAGAGLENTAIAVNSGGTLAVSGAYTAGNVATVAAGASLTLNPGGTFDMSDGAANTFALVQHSAFAGNALTLNGGALKFDIGAASGVNDQIDVMLNATSGNGLATSTGANAIAINAIGGSLTAGNTYTLIKAAGTLSNSNFYLVSPTINVGGTPYSLTLSQSGTYEVLTVSAFVAASASSAFWNGTTNGSWAYQPLGAGTATNWAASATGSPDTFVLPDAATNVTFTTNTVGPGGLSTTLDGSRTINSLTFTGNGTSNTAGSTIAAGTGGMLTINAFALSGNAAGNGITINAGSGANTISAGVILGGSQTWTNNSSNPLTVSGVVAESTALTGLTTSGTGTISLSNSNTYTGPTTINAGVLSVATLSSGGNPSGIGRSSAAVTNLVLGGGTLQYTGGSASIDRNFTINAGTTSTIDVTQAGTMLTLPGPTGAATTGALSKIGAGSLEFTGTYGYTGATTVNAGILRLSGTSAGTSAVTVNSGGTLQFGSTTALSSANALTLAGSGVVDLFGNSVTTGALTTAATTSITNTGAGTSASTATAPGTPSGTGIYVDALTVSPVTAAAVPALITDGPTRKTQIVLNNSIANTQMTSNVNNTYSGGLVLANIASFTRLNPGIITGTPWGSGPIIVGQAATDKAQIYFSTANQTMNNPIISNTRLGTDVTGTVRVDVATTFAGTLTANLAPFTFSTNNGSGSSTVTGRITGPSGLVLDFIGGSAFAGTLLPVTLNNAAGTNDYQGDTVINNTATAGKSATIILGAANQIPNGSGTGNVVINTNGTGVGRLNLGGFSETINGLNGSGTVDGVSGTPTFTVGDNNATASFSGPIINSAGTLTLTKIGSGTQTLSGASTFAGPVNVNGGLIAFATSPATAGPLGNSTIVNLSGGGLSYTATGSNALNRTAAIGASNGTIDVANSLGTLTVASATSSGGNLIKTGPGLLQLTATTTTLSAGAAGVVVNGGTLQGGFGTAGIGSINVGASGYLSLHDVTTPTASILNLTTAGSGALNLASGAQLGFDLGASGTNDRIVYGAATAAGTVTLNFFNLGGLNAGSYTLLTSSTSNGLTGVNFALGSAPTGFNYTITSDNTTVTLTTSAYSPIYWNNTQGDGSWSNTTGSLGSIGGGAGTNFTTLPNGTTDAGHAPLATETVIFNSTTVAGPSISTTLDGNRTIDSLQFIGGGSPAVTSVTINQGTSGTLTIMPQSASGGISILAGGGNATITAPVSLNGALSSSQTWNVTDATSTLEVSGSIAFGASVRKTGLGVLKLSGTNSGSGNFSLIGGTLVLANPAALGTGTLSIAGGTTLDATGGALVLSALAPINVNGDFTFTGSNNLTFGGGAVTVSGNPAINTAAAVLDFNAAIGGSSGLTKAGSGTLVLGSNNSYSGGLTLNAGTLILNNAGALGGGAFTINGGTLDSTSPGVTLNPTSKTIAASFAFTGTNSLNLGTGAISLTTTPTITVNANTLTLSGNISGSSGITKAGVGDLTLSGANTYLGATIVANGTLNFPTGGSTTTAGTITVGNTAATNAVLNVTGGALSTTANVNPSVIIGTGTSSGSVNLSAGSISTSPSGTQAAAQTYIGGTATGGFGALNVSGSGLYTSGSYIAVGYSTNDRGVLNQSSGTITVNNNFLTVAAVSATATGVVNLSGGTFNSVANAANSGVRIGEQGTGILTVSGTAVFNAGFNNTADQGVSLGTTGVGSSGTLNLNGGTINTNKIAKGAGSGFLNFDGGTLMANVANATFVTGLTSAYINGGGATIDSRSFAITIGQALLAPIGSGVSATGLTVSGGGYIATPQVVVSGGGGTGATAVATIDGSGNLTGITITNPGISYTSAPTFTLFGGGNGNSGAIGGTATLFTNTSGGLTKISAGTLTLSGANTYTGPTVISGGTLKLGNTAALGTSVGAADGTTISSGATLDLGGIGVPNANTSAEIITASGAGVGGNGAIISSTAIASPFIGVRNLTLAGDTTLGFSSRWDVGDNAGATNALLGNGYALTFLGTAPAAQASLNFLGETDLGDINVNLGNVTATNILFIQGTTTLGRAANTVSISGGSTLNIYTNSTVTNFDKKFALNNGTIVVQRTGGASLDGTISLTNANTITATTSTAATNVISGTGSLNKAGVGSLTLTGTNIYTGATNIQAGTLALGATGSINNSSQIALSPGATFDVSAVSGYALAQTLAFKGAGTANVLGAVNAGARTLDLKDSVNIGSLALSSDLNLNGATLTFDLSATTSDQIAVTGVATLAGTNTINVAPLASATSLTLGSHAYTLLTAGSGLVSSNFALSNSSVTLNSVVYSFGLSGDDTHEYLDVAIGAAAVAGIWNVNASGSWNTAGNWSGGVPGLSGSSAGNDTATFAAAATTVNPVVTLDGVSPVLKGVTFNNAAHGYTIAQGTGGTLTLDGGAAPATIDVTNGSHTISAPLTLATNTNITLANAGSLTLSGAQAWAGHNVAVSGAGTVTISGTQTNTSPATFTVNTGITANINTNSGAGLSLVNSGTVNLKSSQNLGGVTINSGAHTNVTTNTALPVATGPSVVVTQSLTIASHVVSGNTVWDGYLDLANNKLVVQTGGLSGTALQDAVKQVASQVKSGYNLANGSSTLWMGTGIGSSSAAADTRRIVGLAVFQNNTKSFGSLDGTVSDGTGNAFVATFGTATVAKNDTLVKFTYFGDTDLDGVITAGDYANIDLAFAHQQTLGPQTGWANGDFDYDGSITAADYSLMDSAFAAQSGALSGEVHTLGSLSGSLGSVTAVPEPSTWLLGLLGIIGLLAMARRRRSVTAK